MADDNERNQDPEKLRHPPLRLVDDPHNKETDGDFGETQIDRNKNLRNKTPFRDLGDALQGQANKMFSHARLNSFRIRSERNNTKHLTPY
jgi:hypothetical protein